MSTLAELLTTPRSPQGPGAPAPAAPVAPATPADPVGHQGLRARAAAAVARTAELLADPARVPATPGAEPATLSSGAAGTVLLFTELARADPGRRRAAHAWLAVAAAHTKADRTPRPGLYTGLPALSFAMHRATAAPGDYRAAREHLGGQLGLLAERLVAGELGRIERGERCTKLEAYDLVSGLTGLGAHLLDRHEAGEDAPLAPVLTALVALTRPLSGPGLPGWWVAQDVRSYRPASPREGHANLGLAHGVPGPLALLALAWRAGARVPGQDDAIAVLADWLLARRREDGAGAWWPEYVELESAASAASAATATAVTATADAGAPRPSWCYGTPGIARALQLAGLALGCAQWRTAAVTALLAALDRTGCTDAGLTDGGLTDAGLCHGWAGLLQTTWRVARDGGGAELADRIPELTERLLALHTPDGPFGFAPPPRRGDWADDPAGFLTGAAGAALALHTVATDAAPATAWDRALLLA